jgi:EmrB/QacA subfamily drug resistance transporter
MRGAGLAACPPHPAAAARPRQPGEDDAGARRCQRWTLTVVCLASGLLLFNVTAPNVALPAIAAGLRAGFAEQQWVLSIYALVLASLLLLGGALGDRYGRRRLFLLGIGIFGLGSLTCALAPSALLLIVGRVVQGIGAAALFPAGLALIAAEFAGPARARAIGIWGASVAGAIALGPLLGGALVELAGWRAEFWFAVLLVVPSAAVGMRHLRESRDAGAHSMDWLGTALLTGALSLLIVVVQRGNAIGWTSPTSIAMAAGALLLFAGFVGTEFRVAQPLIAPVLMRDPTFVGATLVALVFAAAGFAPLVYISLFLLQVAGAGPTLAGALIAPFALTSLVVSLLAARVAGRVGVRATLAAGLALCGAGLGLMLIVTPDGAAWRLLPGLVVFGVGGGLVNPTMTVAALSTVSAAHAGMASGVNNTARQVGVATGIAGLGALLAARLASEMQAGLIGSGAPPAVAARAGELAADGDPGAATTVAGLGEAGRNVYGAAFVAALHTTFLVAIGIIALGLVVVLALIRNTSTPAADVSDEMPVPDDMAQPRPLHFDVADDRPHAPNCTHLDKLVDVPSGENPGCVECLRAGTSWLHLRKCLNCGHIGCCDESPGQHAFAHWLQTQHPVVRCEDPGEDWGWCYPDSALLTPHPR